MRQALEEARQFRDSKTELKNVKNDKVIVIDKSDWPTYKTKGWLQAESTQVNEARYEVEGVTGYKGISGQDNFSMVINARNEQDAEDKAIDELEKARNKRKIGPGGGGYLEDTEVESVIKTNDKLSAPETFRGGN